MGLYSLINSVFRFLLVPTALLVPALILLLPTAVSFSLCVYILRCRIPSELTFLKKVTKAIRFEAAYKIISSKSFVGEILLEATSMAPIYANPAARKIFKPNAPTATQENVRTRELRTPKKDRHKMQHLVEMISSPLFQLQALKETKKAAQADDWESKKPYSILELCRSRHSTKELLFMLNSESMR